MTGRTIDELVAFADEIDADTIRAIAKDMHAKLQKAYSYMDNLACGLEVDLGELSSVMDEVRTDVPMD